jgi:predicted enzyme related to lactoylglutathione lyase
VGTRTNYAAGTFCWVDLSTPDPAAAKAFYGELLGWSHNDDPIVRVDGHAVAAVVEQSAGERDGGVPPHWNSYIRVEDADASVARAGDLGATVIGDAFDIGDSGRIGAIIDPTGAAVFMWEPGTHPGAGLVNAPGALTWNELGTSDTEAAQRFYGDLFGWKFETMEGPGGSYIVIGCGERSNGGIRELSSQERQGGVPPNWLPYFVVESANAAVAQAGELGATVLMGPVDMPNEGRIAAVRDPQGAVFALWEGPLDD